MKNRIISVLLSIAMLIAVCPVSAFASDAESLESIKQRVSSIYGIPMNIVETLSEEKIREMDVSPEQVVSTEESYVQYVFDADGNSMAILSSEKEYLDFVSSPSTQANPETDSNGWMKIYLIIVDNGDTLDISSTYTWLIQPRVTYGQHDILTIAWENGSYIRGSAEGFYSYNTDFVGSHSEDLDPNGFVQPEDNRHSINYAHPMNDSGARKNEFFHMMVTIEKNTGLSMEYASSSYSQQFKTFNLAGLLGGAAGVAGALFIPEVGGKILSASLAASSIIASIEDSYETFTVEVDTRV